MQFLLLFKNNFIFLILSVTPLYSQYKLIIDNDLGNPLQDVNIYNDSCGVTSDSSGKFFYNDIFGNNDTITFSLIGYETIQLAKSKIPKIIKMKKTTINLDMVEVFGRVSRHKKKITKIERDVRKVYPYAKVFSNYLENYESIMDTLNNFSMVNRYFKKRKLFKEIEDDLLARYDYSIRKLTKQQGRILIRLIDREANRTSFNIIKDFRNGFTAGFWQITARLFGHNLKSNYNPLIGEDKVIEHIIEKIENPTKF